MSSINHPQVGFLLHIRKDQVNERALVGMNEKPIGREGIAGPQKLPGAPLHLTDVASNSEPSLNVNGIVPVDTDTNDYKLELYTVMKIV